MFGELPRVMKPLEAFRGDMIQIGNLTNNSGRALLDGAGDHGRCAGSYLTGVQVKKTTVDIKASISCDQIIANKIGHQTRFASLELGMDDSRQAGDCDSGYSCAYTNNLAWRSETQPLPPILDPRVLFERLFGTGESSPPRTWTGARGIAAASSTSSRATPRSCRDRSGRPTSGSSKSTCRRFVKWSGSSRRRRRTASR